MALTDGLISWWTLDEVSGTRADAHGANDLTDLNTVTSAAGKHGTAADFEQANSESLLRTGVDLSAITEGTIACWVNFESFYTIYQRLVSLGQSSDRISIFAEPGGAIGAFARWGNSTVADIRGGALSTGTWYHAVLTWDATAIRVYVDNALVAEKLADGTSSFSPTSWISLGRYGVSGANYHDGLLDEVGLWSRALGATDRAALYNAGTGLAYSDLAGGGDDHTLAPSGAASVAAAAVATVTQNHVLAPAGAASVSAAAEATINQGHVLAAAGAAASPVAAEASLTQAHTLSPSGAAAVSAAGEGSVSISGDVYTLTPAGAASTAVAAEAAISQNHVVAPSGATATLAAASVTFTQNHTLNPAGAASVLVAAEATLTTDAYAFAPVGAASTTVAAEATLTQDHVLTPSGAAAAAVADEATLVQLHVLTPSGAVTVAVAAAGTISDPSEIPTALTGALDAAYTLTGALDAAYMLSASITTT